MPGESRFDELKRYVRFGQDEAQLLASFHGVAAPHFPRIAQEFYDRIREHEEAHAVFQDEQQILRLQASLVRWMHRLLSGVYDESYFRETAHIGRVHVKIGLPQRYMFTAMALIRVALTRIAERERAVDDATRVREALTRLLDLDLAIMLETYQDSFVQRIQHVERLQMAELNRALVRAEHRYVNAVELARALIVGVDATGNIRLFNREAERVTGFARDEVIGEPFVATLFPEDVRAQYAAVLGGLLGGSVPSAESSFESVLRTRAGKLRDVVWSIVYAPAGVGESEVVAFAMGNDVTDSKAMEQRTLQVEKLAAVGTLAAGLAHEIRNPLNGAQLHVAFLERAIRKKGADPDMLEAAQVVADEIKRLAVLVSEFLDFARPKPLALQPVSMFALLTRVKDLVTPLAHGAKVDLATDLPSADVELLADAGKLEQVFLNLTKNAVEAHDATGSGGVVRLRMRRQPRHVVVEVEDDGPGLPSPDAPIFDAFFTTKAGGTGLGLAITHRIVTDHRGTIDVSSRPGRTVFKVTLPLTNTEGQ